MLAIWVQGLYNGIKKKGGVEMKKWLAVFLCMAALTLVGCAEQVVQPEESTSRPVETTVPVVTEPPVTEPEIVTDELRAQWDALAEKCQFQGVLYLTHNGKEVYRYISGMDDQGEPLTLESPLYMSSVSKQFCAAAIVMLRDQGQLDLEDPLEKYFPEYTVGRDITLRQLLTMRSGIVRDFAPVLQEPHRFEQMSPQQVSDAMLRWLYEQELVFSPGTDFAYSNVNYTLLSYVVEQVSGERYEDFVQQHIFGPLGMIHSDFINQVAENPHWGLTYGKLLRGSWLGDLLQGCGDIISTAQDMDIWMTALRSGKVVCEESYREMTTDYSDGAMESSLYGYGLVGSIRDGWGHGGNNEDYTSWIYFNEAYGYNYFLATPNTPETMRNQHKIMTSEFLRLLFAAEDAAQ